MKTQLKPKTTPVKEVTKSNPSTSTNSRTSNDGANRTISPDIKDELMSPDWPGVRIAKIRNR